ncbi:MAG: alpha/beta hydrolase family protein [Candidatus Limnocylindria bacterium]
MARDHELRITAGEVVLSGTLTVPDPAPETDGDRRVPAVLLLPSFLPRDRSGRLDRRRHPGWFLPSRRDEPGVLARLAAALASRGVASLRYDKRGCGRSGGRWSEAGLFTLVDDARDAVGVLRGHPAVDPTRIGLVGHGEGAWLALSAAAADPAIGPLTLIGAPARGLRDTLRRSVSERARRRRRRPATPGHPFVLALDRGLEELIERADRGEARMVLALPGGRRAVLGLAAWEQGMQISSRALATLQRRSVTLAHGTADDWVDRDESGLLATALRDVGAPRRVLVPGAGHDLTSAPPELWRDLASDLAARLQPRRLPTVLLSIADPPRGPAAGPSVTDRGLR